MNGTCHCGAIEWQPDGDPGSITACNCTVCRRYGALWAYDWEGERIRISGATSIYSRKEREDPFLEFHFCPSCACVVAWRALYLRRDDLEGPEIQALLLEHLGSMEHTAPPESRHALDLTGLRDPSITFWSVWDGEALAGCGALKRLNSSHAEIKSMRTAASHLRSGVASRTLRHIITEAAAGGYTRLSLETGSMAFFEPARRLYESFGFVPCAPFGDYRSDPNSVFMTLEGLAPGNSTEPTPLRGAD